MILSLPLAFAFVSVGGDSGTVNVGGSGSSSVVIGNVDPCGNNNLDYPEQCDGTDFGYGTCATWLGEGYTGVLSCKAECIIDVTACVLESVPAGYCGDLVCNNGETCSSCSGDCGTCSEGGGSGGNGGGGSGGSSDDDDSNPVNEDVCVEDWSCNGWSECIGGLEMRTCTDSNECGTGKIKPSDERGCNVADLDPEETSSWIERFFAAITGAVIGGGITSWAIAGAFVIFVLGAFGFVENKRKKKSKK